MQHVCKLDEGVKTLEEQAKRLGLEEPQEVYFHIEPSRAFCKCDLCILKAPMEHNQYVTATTYSQRRF
jgi:hypothetical protein